MRLRKDDKLVDKTTADRLGLSDATVRRYLREAPAAGLLAS